MRAERTRTCRWAKCCGWCGSLIGQGDREGYVEGTGWLHAACVLRCQRAELDECWEDGYWASCYTPTEADLKRRRQAQAEAALAFLQRHGTRAG
jgi:hypothetical protein